MNVAVYHYQIQEKITRDVAASMRNYNKSQFIRHQMYALSGLNQV